jgi:hypothetical protein
MATLSEMDLDSSRVVQALAWAAKPGDVTPSQEAEVLSCLEDFECWIPLIKFLNDRIRKDKSDQFLRIRLARIQHRYLHDASGAAETIGNLISDFVLEFDRLDSILTEYICEPEDWSGYAQILELCWTTLSQPKSQIKAIERLCAVFEKKKHDDDRVYEYYSKLLKLDQNNLKALRYFKIIATQSNDWQAVATYLSRLLHTAQHSNDRFRHAQELAAVQLYQLDRPAEALATLRSGCVGSPLDYSNIEFDIYMRTNDQLGCGRVLKRVLETMKDPNISAVLNFKIGMIEESSGQPADAERSYLKAIELDSRLLEPLERLAVMNAKLRNWKNTVTTLKQIGTNLQNESLRAKITQLLDRIESTTSVGK